MTPVGAIATLVAGAAAAITAEVGGALLLYNERGALRAGGMLLALSVGALAAGLWAGRPERAGTTHEQPGTTRAAGGVAPQPPSRDRWRAAAITIALAGVFASLWLRPTPLARSDAGHASAVVLLLGAPIYSIGLVLAALAVRWRMTAVTATLGAALGAAAGALLIARLGAVETLFGFALLAYISGMAESRAAPAPPPGSQPMRGRVVLVTGVGGRGQAGHAVARAFLDAGARVTVSSRDAAIAQIATELGAPAVALGVAADLLEPRQVESLIARVHEHFGRLDIVVNMAGGLRVMKPLAQTTDEEWRDELERNALTMLAVTRAALPLLRQNRGCVVNVASPAGERARARLGAYSAAKAVVIAQTRAFALEEAAHGVRVNAIAPGTIDTESNRASLGGDPDVRWVTRDEVARVAVFLASDDASGVTGEVVHVLGAPA
ncbi:MAG: SDR family NAD(P)-dependent oxidoreductase [Longimicrobiales bacterium]